MDNDTTIVHLKRLVRDSSRKISSRIFIIGGTKLVFTNDFSIVLHHWTKKGD